MPSEGLFKQRPLPYALDALEPHIDAQTMRLHYEKHHAKYVEEANKAMAEENQTATSAEAVLGKASTLSKKLRNNAGGAWNHDFFWHSMRPAREVGEPTGKLRDALIGSFGSLAAFKESFTGTAMARFGSGWAWLVAHNGKLEYGATPDQDGPLMDDCPVKGIPVLGLDVWEHAYYLRYQNKRKDYIDNWFNVVDWAAVEQRLP